MKTNAQIGFIIGIAVVLVYMISASYGPKQLPKKVLVFEVTHAKNLSYDFNDRKLKRALD